MEDMKISTDMRTSAEKLIDLIHGMTDVEADRILLLVMGARIGETAVLAANDRKTA